MPKVTAPNFTSAASSRCTAAEHNKNLWEDIERALVRAIRADPKGLQAIKPRLLHLLHNPVFVNNQDNNIKSLYKACGLESDSDSESESDMQHVILEKQDDDTELFADFMESELVTSSVNICNNKDQQNQEEEDLDVLADFIEGELLASSSSTANLCNNKDQQNPEEEDLDILSDFIEGEMLQASSFKSEVTSSTSICASSATSTSNHSNLDAADYKQKLELSRQKLKAGYAMQQQSKQQHRSILISYTDAKQLLPVQSKLSPKKTITKNISNTKINNCTTAKTKMSKANLAQQQYKNQTGQIKSSGANYPNYPAHRGIYSSCIRRS